MLVRMHQAATIQANIDSRIVALEAITVFYQDEAGDVHDVLVTWEDVKYL
jgi:hypothetical protein